MKVNWWRIVVAAVLAVWIGHFYGLVRYHKELDLYSGQRVMMYTNEVYGQYHKVTVRDKEIWSICASLAAFASIWLLLKAKDNARRE